MLPIKLFMGREKSGGIVLILSVNLAMILANSNIAESYFHFFEQEVGFIVNGEPYLNYSLHHWINDGLMAMFFFVVGLELKREFIGGELADIRNTILPIGAAIGGMIVPALIFLSLNIGTPQTMGWGIPMATDIAFALGVVYLLGDKVPASAKVFLTTLAIVDDLGAVLVIAFFYFRTLYCEFALWSGLSCSDVYRQQTRYQEPILLCRTRYRWCMGNLLAVRNPRNDCCRTCCLYDSSRCKD